MEQFQNVYSSKHFRVERNARLFSLSLRFDKGSNYFLLPDVSSYYIYNIHAATVDIKARLVFYVIMPNHIHLILEALNYESVSKMFQTTNSGFSRYLRKDKKNTFGKNRVFAGGVRYHAIHNMKQFFSCLKYLYDNPAKWNENPNKRKMRDVTENYYGSTTSEILKGTSKYFDAVALKEYSGTSDLKQLLALLRLPKPEFKKKVEEILEKREWNDEKDNKVFKLDPSQPWTNPWSPDDLVYEDKQDEEYVPTSAVEELHKFVDY